jgi:hypothetical protein
MSDNFVTVTGQWMAPVSATADNYGNGNFQFVASGSLMDSPSVALVFPYISGQLDSLGALSLPSGSVGSVGTGAPNSGISLLASDNFGSTAPWILSYNVKIVVQGMETISVDNVPILYSNGASQSIFTLLEAAGWTNFAT